MNDFGKSFTPPLRRAKYRSIHMVKHATLSTFWGEIFLYFGDEFGFDAEHSAPFNLLLRSKC